MYEISKYIIKRIYVRINLPLNIYTACYKHHLLKKLKKYFYSVEYMN